MIPVCKPFWDEQEEQAVLRVMRSGRVIQGPEVEGFEQAVAEYVGVKYAIATSSGTTALHLGLFAMGVGSGDEVLVPAFTFVATANAALMCGAKVRLCDINLDDFCMTPSNQPRVQYVIPVLPFGHPIQVGDTPEGWKERVLQDAACGLGTEFHKGHPAIFSFHATKVITTGEGGMVVTNDPELAGRVRFLRDQKHGAGLAYNYTMTEIQGAIGTVQMGKIDQILSRRKEIAEVYDTAFEGKIAARIPPKGGNYQSYTLLLDENIYRSKVMGWLREKGVEGRMGTQFLGNMTHLKTPGLPNARAAGERAMRIPCYPGMTDGEVELVAGAVREVLG